MATDLNMATLREKLIGLTKEEADSFLRPQGMYCRVIKINETYLVGTADLRRDRVNVSVAGDKIDNVEDIG